MNPYESPTHCEAGEAWSYTLADLAYDSWQIFVGVFAVIVVGPTWRIWEWAWTEGDGEWWWLFGAAILPIWWITEAIAFLVVDYWLDRCFCFLWKVCT